ncbi:MAG: flagellar assembly peptidoglycan hydrolase FlgJ [Pseudomonadota bacterium]
MTQKISSHSDFVGDIQSLKNPNGGAIKNDPMQLKAVAQQFESLFLNMMMQSARQAERVWSEDSPLNSRETEFFQDMLDQQLSTDLAKSSGLGIADMIVKQFSKYVKEDEKADSLIKKPFSMPEKIEEHKIENQKIDKKNEFEMPLSRLSHYLSDTKSETLVPKSNELNNATKNAFVEKIRSSATEAAAALGIDPLILIAQAALETGWGQHMPKQDNNFASHNMFGIKAGSSWARQVANNITNEFDNGWKQEAARFRSYESTEESFDDYVRFIQNNARYQHLQNSDPETYTNGLQQAGFATDPEYANKIMKIVHQLR